MKRVLIIFVLSLALGVLFYMYSNLSQASAGGPKFLTRDALQTSVDVIYRDIEIMRKDMTEMEARIEALESKL